MSSAQKLPNNENHADFNQQTKCIGISGASFLRKIPIDNVSAPPAIVNTDLAKRVCSDSHILLVSIKLFLFLLGDLT